MTSLVDVEVERHADSLAGISTRRAHMAAGHALSVNMVVTSATHLVAGFGLSLLSIASPYEPWQAAAGANIIGTAAGAVCQVKHFRKGVPKQPHTGSANDYPPAFTSGSRTPHTGKAGQPTDAAP